MPEDDRIKWNDRYKNKTELGEAELYLRNSKHLPQRGCVLDIAGGTGRNALFLASLGLEVTLSDISTVGLELAKSNANLEGLTLNYLEIDLNEEFPDQQWDMIFSSHYLDRSLFPVFEERLKIGGVLMIIQPTMKNLERHAHPSARFLLEDNELSTLVKTLSIVDYQEGWQENKHLACITAVKKA